MTHNPLQSYPPVLLSIGHTKNKSNHRTRRIATHHKKWATMMCNVDVGGRMVFRFEEMREQIRKQEGRERREHRKWERGERKFASGEIFFLQSCYSAILPLELVELHCSSITKKFVILGFSILWCRAFWNVKLFLHLVLAFSSIDACTFVLNAMFELHQIALTNENWRIKWSRDLSYLLQITTIYLHLTLINSILT